jgi:hypothetical protein
MDLWYWKGLSMQQLASQSYEALARRDLDSARIHLVDRQLTAEGDDEPTALREIKLAEERDPASNPAASPTDHSFHMLNRGQA